MPIPKGNAGYSEEWHMQRIRAAYKDPARGPAAAIQYADDNRKLLFDVNHGEPIFKLFQMIEADAALPAGPEGHSVLLRAADLAVRTIWQFTNLTGGMDYQAAQRAKSFLQAIPKTQAVIDWAGPYLERFSKLSEKTKNATGFDDGHGFFADFHRWLQAYIVPGPVSEPENGATLPRAGETGVRPLFSGKPPSSGSADPSQPK